jgi:hypothetical protein|tara:strand:- start:1759 stop:3714 length:1956 start_codon:yes stop_codon:yes gene_type:complete
LHKEQRHSTRFLIVLFIVSVSGFATWLFLEHGILQQLVYLVHTLLGFWLTLLACQFLYSHVRIAMGFRRPNQAFMGWFSALCFISVATTGSVIGVIGQYESQRWMLDLHVVSSIAIVVSLLAHIVLYRWLRLTPRVAEGAAQKGPGGSVFAQAINLQLVIRLTAYTLLTCIGIGLLSLLYSQRPSTYVDSAAVPFKKAYGDNIFAPSLAQTSTDAFLDARRIGRSEKCGGCHGQITDQWRASMHGRSASDPFFQKNVHSLAQQKGIEAARYCGGCHIPIALLSGALSPGGDLSAGMHIDEGVSCMGCHGISKVVSLEGVGSYLYEPELHYLFGDSDGWLQTALHNYLMKINPRQHRKDMAREVLYDPTSCATCHEQYIDKELNDWGWIKLQSQYQAWIKGPFSNHSDKNYADDEVYRCQDCHFPLVKGDDPSGDSDGRIRSHRTPAANTAVPFLLNDKEQLDTVISFLQDNRISLTIQLANQQDVRRSRASMRPGDTLTLNVGVSSNRIGHYFPAGTVDINEPWIELVVTDADGNNIYSSGLIDENNQVDKSARFYFSSLVNRQGKRVWRHDLFNVVGESYVNLIHPGRADIQSYEFGVAEWAKGPLKAKARLRYRKLNHDYTSWALDSDAIQLPIVDMAVTEESIALSSR